jgi:hypothetical protein
MDGRGGGFVDGDGIVAGDAPVVTIEQAGIAQRRHALRRRERDRRQRRVRRQVEILAEPAHDLAQQRRRDRRPRVAVGFRKHEGPLGNGGHGPIRHAELHRRRCVVVNRPLLDDRRERHGDGQQGSAAEEGALEHDSFPWAT